MNPNIAILDDEPRMAQVLSMMLRREGYEIASFTDPVSFLQKFQTASYDLVITDLKMPKISGLQILQKTKQLDPDVPVVILTAHGTINSAIEAMKLGAYDYIEKPFDNDACKALVKRALHVTKFLRENRYLRAQLRTKYAFDDVVAKSTAMEEVFSLARRASKSNATVLIMGASGTGKELVARAIHYYSDRVGKPFVAVNCKAFASGVLESELFGHQKGAFTGAIQQKTGIFARAQGGTVFLDEIGEIDLSFQAKLLRVLQEREVQPVGSEKPVPVNIRVVAASNRNLEAEVQQENFREDLYFRLAVIPIYLPPLIERQEDILPLARLFLMRANQEMKRQIQGWDQFVEQYFLSHTWPGNVRELQNMIERAVVLTRDNVIHKEDILLPTPRKKSEEKNLQEFLDDAAKRHVATVLQSVNGKRAEAAEKLGIDRSTLYRLMKKYQLDKSF